MAKSELGTKRICPETGRKFLRPQQDPGSLALYGSMSCRVIAPAVRHRAEAACGDGCGERGVVVPETQEAEFVSLEDADAEAQGRADGEAVEGDEIELEDEPMDDATFIEETEEGDDDVGRRLVGDVNDEEEA